MYRAHLFTLIALFLFIWTSACGDPEDFEMADSTPIDAPKLYQQHCRACHGEAGQGGIGKPLNGPHIVEMSEAQLFMMIYDGIGLNMPSFKSTLTSDQIAELVVYLRTL